MELKNKNILITGGAGYLGKALVKKLHKDNKIVVYSRDEAKHYFLTKEFPNVECVIGDVGDAKRLEEVSGDYEIDTGIFCASLKQIEACDKNPEEAAKTILQGALNSKNVAKSLNFESACFISTDKACAPSTYYGQLKAAAETSFVYKGKVKNGLRTRFSSCRYGNVVASTGSAYKLMHDAVEKDYGLTLFSPEMTRFFITVEDAVDLVLISLTHSNQVIIPKLNSYSIKDSFELFAERFGLNYKMGTPRPNEKIHEVMISAEELPRTCPHSVKNIDYFTLEQSVTGFRSQFANNEFSSRDVVITKDQLRKFLENHNWFE